MVNTLKIKGKIAENGKTIQEISREMNLSAYQLGKKIAGTADMTLSEADTLQSILKIPDADFLDYFFSRQVANCN